MLLPQTGFCTIVACEQFAKHVPAALQESVVWELLSLHWRSVLHAIEQWLQLEEQVPKELQLSAVSALLSLHWELLLQAIGQAK